MKSSIWKTLCFIFIALTCISCSKPSNDVEQVEEVPTMRVEYTVDGKYNEVTVSSGTASWRYENEDGTGFGVNSDAPHPLDMLGVMPEIDKSDDLNELKISFLFAPDSFFVRRWVDDYIGKAQEYADSYEAVAITDAD